MTPAPDPGGPLDGVRVVELVGLGPGWFTGMMLADLGAEVVRVDRVAEARAVDRSRPATNAMHRGKRSVALDLKQPAGVEAFLRLGEGADAVIEVFRPGVAERLGIGPDACLARNPRLVYGRLTGWGQDGPLAQEAGHDLDYIAVSGALEPLGRAGQPPTPPINVLGDFAGGGMLLAYGIVSALLAAARSGRGQVVDAAMVDGAALLLTPFFAARNSGFWGPRGTNHLDTGAHFYEVYECADGRWVAVGAIEPPFYAALLEGLGLAGDEDPAEQMDASLWPAKKERFAAIFRTRTRDEWCAAFAGNDACVAPVLAPDEAPAHPHAVARSAFLTVDGVPQPAPAPRFSATPERVAGPPQHPGADTDAVLAEVGYSPDELTALRDAGAIA
ncbi:MAG: CoA transferase [Acidimicrobiales bacterium]|nr:CoA transferase [Acidimicrobiales bacterium]MCB1014785.1 CoA transferase [Acidimicrobiales bacterium]